MPSKTNSRSRGRRKGAAAFGYASVPPGLGLDGPEADAQRVAIEGACRRLGLDLIDLVVDYEPGASTSDQRHGLLYVLERMDAGEASCLVVSELERLSATPGELATVLDRLEDERGRLVAVDVALDTATAAGRLAVSRRPGVSAVSEPAFEPPPVAQPAQPAEPAPPAPPVVEAERPARALVRAFGYASAPADGDPAVADDLTAQKHAIERTCERLGFELIEIVSEREPKTAKALDRAGISYLLDRLAGGDASCLVVSGLERLSRSVAELGTLVQWLEKSNVRLVAVELDLDTSSPGGRTAARALASVGGWERERLSERTSKGLAAARARRHAGADSSAPDWGAVRKRIALMRADGMTLQAIADVLNEEGMPTPRGGAKWRPSSVQTAAGYKRRTRARNVADLPTPEGTPATSEPPAEPPTERS